MTHASYCEFRAALAALPAAARADPADYGPGKKLLFSCGHGALLVALQDPAAERLGARGVGRLHILVEIDGVFPDASWVAGQGEEIARFFERIGGTNPQVALDTNAEYLPDDADIVT